jgi:hypothetical protein
VADTEKPAMFFLFGVPKSGTTWLQMLLDAHPQASCPSEHQTERLFVGLKNVILEYHRLLVKIDRNTGRRGVHLIDGRDMDAIARDIVERYVRAGTGGRQVVAAGLKDNTILRRFDRMAEMFPEARFVCLVRDPRDVAISAWHFNLRNEAGFTERVSSLDEWCRVVGRNWHVDMANILDRNGAHRRTERMLIVRYEDLAGDTAKAVIASIAGFLGIAADDETIGQIREQTRFAQLSRPGSDEKSNPFYRAGPGRPPGEGLSSSQRQSIVDAAAPTMRLFHYDTA